jgi:para-nitrobenzyl esterase
MSLTRRTLIKTAALTGAAVVLPRPLFANSTSPSPIVETAAGKVQGGTNNGVFVFKGIPYGATTEGAGRFKAPKPAPAWAGVKSATAFGHAAPQGASLLPPASTQPTNSSLVGDQIRFSEDCLYLNVWTPACDNRKRPVMVWLHGGGFSNGSGASPLYDGSNLARKQDVVVLTINHRLNVFGYLDLSEIAGDEYADSSLAGMLDIVLALRWVKENIERFGGDPDCVTIFGESGGGRKVSVMMAMPAAQGLFHRAIVQSGSALRMDSRAVGAERAEQLLAVLGLKRAEYAKLMTLPVERLLAAADKVARTNGQFRPTSGAPSLPAHPFDPLAPSISADVPLMIGTNLTEVTVTVRPGSPLLTLDEAAVLERIEGLVPPSEARRVLDVYKRAYPGMLPSDLFFRIATDRGYFLDSTIQAERKADLGAAPAFLYSFNWLQPLVDGRTHSPHGSEIAFVFDNAHLARGNDPAPLAALMATVWATFARTGNPSTSALQWPAYNADARPTMIFDKESRVENDPRGEFRKLMLEFGSQQYAEREIPPLV